MPKLLCQIPLALDPAMVGTDTSSASGAGIACKYGNESETWVQQTTISFMFRRLPKFADISHIQHLEACPCGWMCSDTFPFFEVVIMLLTFVECSSVLVNA